LAVVRKTVKQSTLDYVTVRERGGTLVAGSHAVSGFWGRLLGSSEKQRNWMYPWRLEQNQCHEAGVSV
jgi:hypothetical protein